VNTPCGRLDFVAAANNDTSSPASKSKLDFYVERRTVGWSRVDSSGRQVLSRCHLFVMINVRHKFRKTNVEIFVKVSGDGEKRKEGQPT
jgi:hypothetical protein